MTFFNKKEDVIHIELTPHGRHLLSKGKLKPYGYSFFDDDVIYESEKAGITEDSSITKTRILVNTPNLKPQASYKGIESEFNNSLTIERDNVLLQPIGTNKPSSLLPSAWQATMIRGEISSSSGFMSSSSPIIHIPQIECEINYTLSLQNLQSDSYIFTEDIDTTEAAESGNYIQVAKQDLIVHLLEKNGFSYKDSLNIEVFLYSQDEQSMDKLKFLDRNQKVVNDLFITDPDLKFVTGDENTVETYFYVNTDSDISEEDICKGITNLRDNDIYLGFDLECEEDLDRNVNVYQTDVEDIEDCDI